MLTDAEQVDAVEDRAAGLGQLSEGDRVPSGLADPQDRRARIRAAVQEVTRQARQQAEAEQVREAAARQRRERAQAGESV